MIIQADGKAVAVGQSSNGINWEYGIVRMLTTSAADCSYSLSPASQTVAQAGGSFSAAVTTTGQCTWTAVSNAGWLNFTGSTNGTGNGTVAYSVDPNPNAVSRTGTITVGGQTLSVTQFGANVAVSIPTALTGQNGSALTVPVNVGDTTGQGILSYDFTLAYDPAVLVPQVVPADASGTLSSAFTITVNPNTPGTLVVSGFGTSVLSGAGTLLNLKFNVVGNYPSCSALNFTALTFNAGNPPNQTASGQFCVINGNISGTIRYVNGAPTQPGVQNVTVSAVGSTTITGATDAGGYYELTGFSTGAYTVTPSKTGDANGITSFDASLVAQHVVGLTTLSGSQQLAGDTNNNGALNSFDAALIAQYSVNIANPLSIAGTWKFSPASRSYPNVVTDTPNQNYDAILVGEVSGNWTPPSPFAGFFDEKSVFPAERSIAVGLPDAYGSRGSTVTVPVTVGKDVAGMGVVAYQVDFNYDPAIVEPDPAFVSTAGTMSDGLSVTVNNATAGRTRIAVFGTAPIAGQGTLINLRFRVIGAPNQVSPLTWTSFFFNEGSPHTTAGSGRITVLAPTAANAVVAGRVTTAEGAGIRGAAVTLTDAGGRARTVTTGTFGYYNFADVPVGTAVLTVTSKRYAFDDPTRIIDVRDNVGEIVFTATGR
ncbi:MAG: carboxypeptidase regulatory-like domain-containing protein [Acidobacteria bacterium]|nr:carboxypeptidase regulatory-like domain-containing protein [Acidobacteriota bacterium]